MKLSIALSGPLSELTLPATTRSTVELQGVSQHVMHSTLGLAAYVDFQKFR